MTSYSEQSKSLTDALGLTLPPIAVALLDRVPDGVPTFDGVAAAGCRFWQEAASRTFATVTADHELCGIGVHTHNMAGASDRAKSELGAALKVMAQLDYVRDEDVAAIPVIDREVSCVVYGPLAEAPVEPDAVLLFTRANQSLIVTEAAQQVDGAIAPALGRPACAVVPQVVNSGRAAMSLGCCGARAYLDALADDVALWALPGARVADYAARIDKLAAANKTLGAFHARRRADVEAGERPTLEQSLARIS
jgi:uncharacterized protein (DUF169 family)